MKLLWRSVPQENGLIDYQLYAESTGRIYRIVRAPKFDSDHKGSYILFIMHHPLVFEAMFINLESAKAAALESVAAYEAANNPPVRSVTQ